MNLNALKKSAEKTAKKEAPKREYIAIVATAGLVGVYTGKPEESVYQVFDNTAEGALNCLKVALENLVPRNDERLLDKQIAIYMLDAVWNIHAAPGDLWRDESFDDLRDLVEEVEELAFARRRNFVYAREKGSNAEIVKKGWDWLKSVAKESVKKSLGQGSQQPAQPIVDACVLQELSEQLVEASRAGNTEQIVALSNAIAQLSGGASSSAVTQEIPAEEDYDSDALENQEV